MRVKKDKCYIVREIKSKYTQGAFPYTPEGLKEAQKYLRKINKSKKYEITEG